MRKTHGDSVTQKEGQVTLSEDEFLFINCTYSSTTYPTLFWYVQYPGQGLQLLLQVTTANNKGSSRGFEATYDKATTSFHLQKASVQESDSAVYYCVMDDTVAETTGGAEHKLWEAIASLTSDHLPLNHPVFHRLCYVPLYFSGSWKSYKWSEQNKKEMFPHLDFHIGIWNHRTSVVLHGGSQWFHRKAMETMSVVIISICKSLSSYCCISPLAQVFHIGPNIPGKVSSW